ncbi:MAG: multiheme c-type cytochrome [Planctomycetota bacterium]
MTAPLASRRPAKLVGFAAAAAALLVLGRWVAAGGGDAEPLGGETYFTATSASSKEKPDPVKANGTIFKTAAGADWPKPAATLVFTGEQDGYLEPCGCAGLTNQKGGLKRRHTFLKQLTAKGWAPLPLDVGGQIKRYGQQAQLKYGSAVGALIELGYRGVGFGARDLRMDLLGVAINLDPGANPLTSANVGLLGFDPSMSARWRTAEAGGLKIGFTQVLADSQAGQTGAGPDTDIEDARSALRRVTPELQAEACDHLVLMVYGTSIEARALAKEFPAYRWVVSAVGADEPPHRIEPIGETGSYLIQVGHKGMYAVAVGLYPGATPPFRYQKVPLDHRFEDSPEMNRMLARYQDQLKTLGFDGLGVKPQLHATAAVTDGKFAGSAACADCHYEEYEIWEKTAHSHATRSIVDLDPARHFDPECLSCHATGWNPQKYHPYVTGYLSLDDTPHLNANGCENCHGPAAKHVAVENGDFEVTDAEQEAIYAALHLEIVDNEGNMEGQSLGKSVNTCLECHDLDNSPDFDFQQYWQLVKHGSRWTDDDDDYNDDDGDNDEDGDDE